MVFREVPSDFSPRFVLRAAKPWRKTRQSGLLGRHYFVQLPDLGLDLLLLLLRRKHVDKPVSAFIQARRAGPMTVVLDE